jgi:hypothetical protein
MLDSSICVRPLQFRKMSSPSAVHSTDPTMAEAGRNLSVLSGTHLRPYLQLSTNVTDFKSSQNVTVSRTVIKHHFRFRAANCSD